MENERQTNYTIMEGYDLPSGGLIYDTKVNPHVELRSMTARDEMKRLAPSTTQFKVIADIIEGCMLEKPAVHVYDMALGDYEFLLHKLRKVTYGKDYKMAVRCPYCGETTETIADLDTLEIKEFDIDEFKNLQEFTLPISKHTISLNFQTPRILDEITGKQKELRKKFKNAELDFELLSTLTFAINTVDGEPLNDYKLETFVENLPGKDMMKILNNLDKINNTIGIKNELFVDCDSCGKEVKTFFRLGTEFFRPTTV